MVFFNKKEKEKFRNLYKGTKVELIQMSDPQAPPPGTKGIVQHVDDIGTIHVKWESGSSLGLIPGEDTFIVID